MTEMNETELRKDFGPSSSCIHFYHFVIESTGSCIPSQTHITSQ